MVSTRGVAAATVLIRKIFSCSRSSCLATTSCSYTNVNINKAKFSTKSTQLNMATRDPASNQLTNFKAANPKSQQLTNDNGAAIGGMTNSMTAGVRGPLLVQDAAFFNELAHFGRERIPERVVHAKGAGAFGYFEVTHDITKYCKAKIFDTIGKRTPLAVRFSTVAGEKGSSDTVRDPRGFAVKFYTEDGNWDLTGNNTPIFFIRDPILFPSFIHTQKRNPVTNLKDPDMFWDFVTLRHETAHQMTFVHSDRGIPDGHRHMNGYGSHTFKMVNADGKAVYCKFHYKTDQGIRNIPVERAAQLASSDPDYSTRDLYNAIANGNYPSWTFYIQVMTFEQTKTFQWNPFDLTKIWPHKEYPLIKVGKIVLDRNPVNYFAEIEQIAFSPASMVPGIEPSPDKMLQGRLFSYDDTHRYRLGANFMQIPVNCPYRTRPQSYHRDGLMCVNQSFEGAPNYYPNSFSGPVEDAKFLELKYPVEGDVARHKTDDDDNYTQVAVFITKTLGPDERERLADNIGRSAGGAQDFIQERVAALYTKIDPQFGNAVRKALNKHKVPKGNL